MTTRLHSKSSALNWMFEEGRMTINQDVKTIVCAHMEAFDSAASDRLIDHGCGAFPSDFEWRSRHPLYEKSRVEAIISEFWWPLRAAFKTLQSREGLFFAALNGFDDGRTVWTCRMSHFVGLFDPDWLSSPLTGRLAHLRYAEFMCVQDGTIVESALFFDLRRLIHEAGVYPLPTMTGAYFVYPRPQPNDGVLIGSQDAAESNAPLDQMSRMIADLDSINHLNGGNAHASFARAPGMMT